MSKKEISAFKVFISDVSSVIIRPNNAQLWPLQANKTLFMLIIYGGRNPTTFFTAFY